MLTRITIVSEMFARMSSYDVPEEQAEAAAKTFRQAIAQIRVMKGLVTAYLLVDPESGRVVTITLWQDAASMEASRVTASRLRNEAVRALKGSVLSIEEYQVAAREFGDFE